MSGVIYVTRCLTNGKLYVGLHTQGRKTYLGSGHALKAAIKKHGRANFVREDIDAFEHLSEGRAKEQEWILRFNSKAPHGYNLCDGGLGVINPAAETREKIRVRLVGHPVSAEARAKMSATHIGNRNASGHHLSDEAKKKISIYWERRRIAGIPGPLKGRRIVHQVTEIHRSNLRAGALAAWTRRRMEANT